MTDSTSSMKKLVAELDANVENTLATRMQALVKRWNREYLEYRVTFAFVVFIWMLAVVMVGTYGVIPEAAMDWSHGWLSVFHSPRVLVLTAAMVIVRAIALRFHLDDSVEDQSHARFLLKSETLKPMLSQIRGSVVTPISECLQSIAWMVACLLMSSQLVHWAKTLLVGQDDRLPGVAFGLVVTALALAIIGIGRSVRTSNMVKSDMHDLLTIGEAGRCRDFERLVNQNPTLSLLPKKERELRAVDFYLAREIVDETKRDAESRVEKDACARLHSQLTPTSST